jgi:hypothetical protein
LSTQFSQFSLSPALMARLDANKFEIPTPVQVGAIPPALEGRDVLATAQTGTGKTLSYLIPIVEMLQKTQERGAHALILLPTRELAMQVEQAFKTIRSSSQQAAALVVGGMAERPQIEAIRRGARLIVATPSASRFAWTRSRSWYWTKWTGCWIWAFSPPFSALRPCCPRFARRFATRQRWKAQSRMWPASISTIRRASRSARS